MLFDSQPLKETVVLKEASYLQLWWQSIDRIMLVVVLTLMGFGVFMVTTSSSVVAERLGYDSFHFTRMHLIYLTCSIFCMLTLSALPKIMIRRLMLMGFVIMFFVMIYTPIWGLELNNATRWLEIAGFTIQPSEFMKPCLIMITAWLMAGQGDDEQFPGTLLAGILGFFTVLLVFIQPDLGMTMLMIAVWITQAFVAGMSISMALLLMACGFLMAYIAYLVHPYINSRLDRFLDPSSGDTFQVDRSIEAFQRGGLFGTGPAQGEIKMILPDGHADFIFAIAGEELGLIFTLFMVFLYFYALWHGFRYLLKTDNLFVVIACSGLLTLLGLQTFIHMSSSLQILPAKGMTLPFVSYGGSSLVSMGIVMGLYLGLTRQTST